MISALVEHKLEPKKPKYPYIGIIEDVVVLFFKEKTGTLLQKSCKTDVKVGQSWDDWQEHRFTPLIGRITLEND